MPEVMIIGAGPAGLAAALQLKRYGIDHILIERSRVGGLLNNANLVENYPGFPGGISGEDLVSLFSVQVTKIGVEVTYDEVQLLDYSQRTFKAVGRFSNYLAPITIVASGTLGKLPEGITVPETIKDKVITEIFSIKTVENRRIVIVGAGDLAFDYALNLGKKNQIVILNRSEELKCLPLLQDRITRVSSVKYQDRTQLVTIQAGYGDEVVLGTITPNGSQEFACDYLVFAIGREPWTGYFSDNLRNIMNELEKKGTLYLIGDVRNGIFRQAAIAIGDGINCATKIQKTLEEQKK